MDIISHVLNVQTLFYIFAGVASGICIGALPGLTATMGVALLLPFTFSMESASGVLLLLGVYIGAIYGGSISAILLKTPGTPASAATAIDGYEFSKRGEAGRALGIGTLSSFMAGTVSCIILSLVAPQLAKFALKFSNAEYFLLAVFGLSIISSVSGKSPIKGLMCGFVGILISMVGIDRVTGYVRFTFDNPNFLSGISYIPIMIGLFAMSQVFVTVEELFHPKEDTSKLNRVLPTKSDFLTCLKTAPISGVIGTMIGIIPGAGADIGTFVAYNEAKRFSKHPEKFGTGLPEAIAAAEGGNNGVTGGAMIPMLTLGIPGDSVAAIMIGALTVQGLQPGPLLFTNHPEVVYTIFFGLFIANVFMLLLGFSAIRLFSKVLNVKKRVLTCVIFALCIVGSFAINNNFMDVIIMLIFGIFGYFMNKTEIPVSPMVLGLILGPLAESNFRTALLKSKGSFDIFWSSPIAMFFLFMIFVTLFFPMLKSAYKSLKLKSKKE